MDAPIESLRLEHDTINLRYSRTDENGDIVNKGVANNAEFYFPAQSEKREVEMSIGFTPAEDSGRWFDSITAYLSARQARSIAYSLLWYANELEP